MDPEAKCASMGKLGTLLGVVILGLLGLSGCASSFAPLRPLEKGEIRHGFGLQLMNASLANYGLTYGALPYLETGFQVGLFNVGARARLHYPLGPASSLALSQSGLFFFFGDPDIFIQPRLRYEGRLSYLAFARGFEYGAGPLFLYDWIPATMASSDRQAIRLGGSLSFGTPKVVLDMDLSFNAPYENLEPYEEFPLTDAPEVALRISWFWGSPGAAPSKPSASRAPSPMPKPADEKDSPSSPPPTSHTPTRDIGRGASRMAVPPSRPSASAPSAPPDSAALLTFGAELCGLPQREFTAWMNRSPTHPDLVLAAHQAALARKSNAVGKTGLGLAAGVLGSVLFTAGLLLENMGSCPMDLSPGGPPEEESECSGSSGNGAPLMLLGGVSVTGGLLGVYAGLRQGYALSEAENALLGRCCEEAWSGSEKCAGSTP